jgi:hypothetical protein|tara:strand:+ start:148 stop:489 length:342 start_codon:yes stop_codon:yes gene_type:complete
MEKQIKTIDVDQIWRYTKNKNSCSSYKLYAKVDRKYINPIVNDIENIEYSLRGKKLFNLDVSSNKNKIHNILDSVDRSFNNDDLKELLEKELSLIEFIYKVYAIRKRNAGELA